MSEIETIQKNKGLSSLDQKNVLQKKAAFLDELLDFIEEKSLGYLMESTEQEKNIPLAKAKRQLS